MTPTTPSTTATVQPSRPVRRAQTRKAARAAARSTPQAENRCLTEAIIDAASAKAAAAEQAATLAKAQLAEAEVQAWLNDMDARLEVIFQHPEQNLGEIEEQLARSVKEPLRLLAQRAAQVKANAVPCHCPECHRELTHQKYLSRTIHSRFGPLTLWRRYGWCPRCGQWHFPADYALGLGRKAPASPYLQEISALLVSKMPAEQAVLVAARLGLDLSRCGLHQEAHRQGLKAQEWRARFVAQLDTWEQIKQVAGTATEGPPAQPFTLVIEIDAWDIRERDDWGKTKELRQQGKKPERWHWVYMATVFRLDHRGQTAGQRAVITQRGYAATRLGVEALSAQLYREAVARGLGQAPLVLVIADGALWIWNLAQDRFPNARQRLDLFHADEHLWAVAHDLYGRGTPEAQAWVTPLLQQIRDDQTVAVMASLAELKPRLLEAQQKKVQAQIEYFEHHADRMKYKEVLAARKACEEGQATEPQQQLANHPVGSGAIESACRQYQCRFKRTGQFWTTPGDEALMCLETLWRNGRWHQLYPHAQSSP
ncbi:MAG: hypothetical protein HY784_19390, partial [Chloroflexi bacterium]|nr:hypothetical protein [Chloroflexota bacterium]